MNIIPDAIATDTGLLDSNGDTIMRAPNEMGFVWSDSHHTSSKGE